MKKFIVSSELLKAALKKLAQAINKNSTLPVLTNLYCKVNKTEVQFITSDLELTIIINCQCEASHQFEMLIPFEFLRKIVSLSDHQPLEIQMNGHTGKIKGENDVYEMGHLDKVADYPNLPEMPKQKFIELNGSFISWLGSAQATCGKDETRPALTMICLDIDTEKVVMASTDATVIFTHSFPVQSKEKDQLLISPKIAKALEGFDSTQIYWRKTHIAFVSGNTTIIATRHEEKFPDYKAVFPSYEPNLLLDRAGLLNALERACLSTSGTKHTVLYFKKEPGTVHFETIDELLNRKILVDIPGSYKGDLERIAVNAEKLLTLIGQVDYDKVNLAIHEAIKPILITAESDPEYTALIVPLTINE